MLRGHTPVAVLPRGARVRSDQGAQAPVHLVLTETRRCLGSKRVHAEHVCTRRVPPLGTSVVQHPLPQALSGYCLVQDRKRHQAQAARPARKGGLECSG